MSNRFAPACKSPSLVMFKRGRVVPLGALQLAWSLEGRGATFELDGPDLVVETPAGMLTLADRAAITRVPHLIAILEYQPSEACAQ